MAEVLEGGALYENFRDLRWLDIGLTGLDKLHARYRSCVFRGVKSLEKVTINSKYCCEHQRMTPKLIYLPMDCEAFN